MGDALGNLVGFHLTGGEAHDLLGAAPLLPDMQADTLIADKGFDADVRVIEPLAAAGMVPMRSVSAPASSDPARSGLESTEAAARVLRVRSGAF